MIFRSLQFKLSAVVFAFGLLMIGMNVYRQYQRDVEARLEGMRAQAYQEGTRLAGLAQHFFRKHLPQSADLAISQVSVNPDLRLGVIADSDDMIRNATQKQWRRVALEDSPLAATKSLVDKVKEKPEGVMDEELDQGRLTAIFPFKDASGPLKKGVVILRYDLNPGLSAVRRNALNESAAQSCLLVGGCLLLWSLLRLLVTRRVSLIVEQTCQIGAEVPVPAPLHGGDELAAISVSIADATRRLRDAEWRFGQIASNMSDVFWVAPPSRAEPVYVNHAYERVFGRPAERLASRRWEWLRAVVPEDVESALQMLRHLRRNGGEQEIEIRVQSGGRVEWLRCRGFATKRPTDTPGSLQVAGMASVITEEKEMEKRVLEAAEHERRRIGQDLHDDVCQRLAAAQLKSGVLGSALKREGHSQAALAVEVGRELSEASEIARGFSRGLAPVAFRAEELPDALEDLRRFLERAFDIRCHVSCEDAPLALDTGCAAQVFRIIQELATNAAKHGKGEWIKISVVHAGEFLRIEVTNDGISYDSATGARTRGMGMHMLRQRANALGASLSIRPRKAADGGTQAVCEIPLARP